MNPYNDRPISQPRQGTLTTTHTGEPKWVHAEQAVPEEAVQPFRALPDWLFGYNCILDSINAQLDALEDRASYLLAPAPKAVSGSLAGKPDDADTPERLSRLEYRLHYLSNRIDEFHKRLIV